MDRDREDEGSLAASISVFEPVAVSEPLVGDLVDGYMIVPEPLGFLTFFNRRGIFRLLICSIVRGWMTLCKFSNSRSDGAKSTHFTSVVSKFCCFFRGDRSQ